MKKSLILIICLFVLSAGIFYFAFSWVSEGKEAISVEETVLYGDRNAAEGITVRNQIHCGFHMFWDTEYTVDRELAVKTHYRYSQIEQREDEIRPSDMQIYTYINYAMSGTIDLSDQKSYELPLLAAADVAKRTPSGETHEELLSLADYYQFYPVSMDLYLSEGRKILYNEQKDMADYFKIPVSQDHKVRVSVTKDKNGSVSYIEQNSEKGDINISAGSAVVAAGGGYCAVSVTNDIGNQVRLPENLSGIHFLPFSETKDGLEPSFQEMRRVYLLSENVRVLRLMKDPEEERLLLFTKENDTILLSVIDMNTMELIQKTELGKDAAELELWDVKKYDSFLVPVFSDYHFTLLSRDSDGLFRMEFAGNLGQDKAIAEKFQLQDAVMDYDGARLAVAVYQPYTSFRQSSGEYQYFSSHSTYLMVFDREGLLYAGKYDQSSDELIPEVNNDKSLRAVDKNPLTVRFE
jgi:hypothetical protein